MPSSDDARRARVEELEQRIRASAAEAETGIGAGDASELSELSLRAHQSITTGVFGHEPTELRIRLHGAGVIDHRVPADQAGGLLRQTQLVVRWIGSRLRTLGDDKQLPGQVAERASVKEATRLFLQPQLGAGSLIFNLVAETAAPVEDPSGALVTGPVPADTLLDRSLQELLSIVAHAQADSEDALGELTASVSRMGPRVASQLKRLADHVTEDEIDIDLRWRGAAGRRRSANLSRRGALAIQDAVARNKVKVDEITLTGLLETASTGKDQIRIEVPGESFKMDVDEELGVTLGRWLHREVTARVERRVTWHDTGKETSVYKLLAIEAESQLDWEDDGSEEAVRPLPDVPDESGQNWWA